MAQAFKSALLALSVIVFSTFAVQSAHAQASGQAFRGFSGNSKEPIQIGADELEILDEQGRATYTGRVQVTQGCSTLKADKLIAFYGDDGGEEAAGPGGRLDRLEFSGNVFVSSGRDTATADKGSYDARSEDVVLEGNVIVSQGRNAAKGCKLTANLKTNRAKLHSCGKRVQTMLNPNAPAEPAKPCN